MRNLQRYLFRQLLWPLVLSCASLAVLALLTQTLSNLSFILDEGEGLLLFLKITVLTLPQLLGLVLPVALFIAVAQGLHRLHTDSELIVAATSGLSRWGVISPVLRLTAIVMVVHLAVGLWLQPISYREMRRTIHEARIDLAASLIAPGEFNAPADDLTIFVRAFGSNGDLNEVMIEDRRDEEQPILYLAERGRLVQSATAPTILLQDGSIQAVEPDGTLSFVNFDTFPIDLTKFIEPPGQLFYKLSDRFLYELFFANPAHFWERENANEMAAEGHSRLAAPLYDLALALIAALALLGGDFSRMGYGKRIAVASLGALMLRLGGFAMQSAGASTPAMNAMQYVLPVVASAVLLALFFGRRWRLFQRLRRPGLSDQMAPA